MKYATESPVAGLSICIAVIGFLLLGFAGQARVEAQEIVSEIEIPQDLAPMGANEPAAVDEGVDHYGENGFPEDAIGLLVVISDPAGYMVYLENIVDPFLLYAQFVNRQRDAILLARSGSIDDPLPNGEVMAVPYGHGALRTSTSYVSLVEGVLLPHISDNQKEYEHFIVRDCATRVCWNRSSGRTTGPSERNCCWAWGTRTRIRRARLSSGCRAFFSRSKNGICSAGARVGPDSDPAGITGRIPGLSTTTSVPCTSAWL